MESPGQSCRAGSCYREQSTGAQQGHDGLPRGRSEALVPHEQTALHICFRAVVLPCTYPAVRHVQPGSCAPRQLTRKQQGMGPEGGGNSNTLTASVLNCQCMVPVRMPPPVTLYLTRALTIRYSRSNMSCKGAATWHDDYVGLSRWGQAGLAWSRTRAVGHYCSTSM